MKFTIFKKTGEYTLNGEWDGDDGYYTQIEVPCREVQEVIIEFIIDSYCKRELCENDRKPVRKMLTDLIDDYGLFEQMCEDYKEELREYYEEYGNE